MRMLSAISAVICLVQPAVAVEAGLWGGSYYCVEEISGGLAYDEVNKRWESSTFSSTDKFLLTMKFDKTVQTTGLVQEIYHPTITEAGTSVPLVCYGYGPDTYQVLVMMGVLNCAANFAAYVFNFDSHRYMKTYANGYVSGDDTGQDTPFIAGGICTKID